MATSHTSIPSSGSGHTAARTSGAIIGIIVFLVGIALLGYVFMTARALFDAPLATLPTATPTPAPTPGPAGAAAASTVSPLALALGQSLTQFAQKLLVLLLMCIAGSVIASRGVDFFFKSLAAAPVKTNTPPAPPAPPAP
jgi:hypothetical protein